MLSPRPLFRLVAALLSVIWLSAGAALAHAEFRGSDPMPDAVLSSLPRAVSLRFSEEVGPLALTWRLPDGREVAARALATSADLQIAPPPDGGAGSYVLKWRVASADGHPIGGALVFSVGHVTGTGDAAASGGQAASVMAVMLRAVMVGSLVVIVGATLFRWLVAPVAEGFARRANRLMAVIPAAGLLMLGVEGLDRLDLPASALFGLSAWRSGLGSPAALAVVLASVAGLIAGRNLRRPAPAGAAVAWFLAAASFAVAGHALSAPRTGVPLTFLHAGAMLVWAGGLLPLAASLRAASGANRAVTLRRFGRVALPAVIVLIASGAGLILMRHPGAATLLTPWARLLAVKLACVAAMLALALWHRFRSTPGLEHGRSPRVLATLRAEATLGLLVVMLAMGFRLAPPPSAPPSAVPAERVMLHLHSAKAMVLLTPSRTPPGPVSFAMAITDADFAPLAPLEVRLSLTDRATGIGPLKAEAHRQMDGTWATEAMVLPSEGPWEVGVTLLISDFEQITLTASWPRGTGESH